MKVFITPEAQGQLKKLVTQDQNKVSKKFVLLVQDPLSGKKLTGQFRGKRSLKAWPYRIIYSINAQKELWVESILHRQGAYK